MIAAAARYSLGCSMQYTARSTAPQKNAKIHAVIVVQFQALKSLRKLCDGAVAAAGYEDVGTIPQGVPCTVGAGVGWACFTYAY